MLLSLTRVLRLRALRLVISSTLILSRLDPLTSSPQDHPFPRVLDQLVSKAKWLEERASSLVAASVATEVASVEAAVVSEVAEASVEIEAVSVVAEEVTEVASAVAVVASEVNESPLRYV